MRQDTLHHATTAWPHETRYTPPCYPLGVLCSPPRVRMDTASNLWTTLNTRLLCVHRNMWQSCDVHVIVMWCPCEPCFISISVEHCPPGIYFLSTWSYLISRSLNTTSYICIPNTRGNEGIWNLAHSCYNWSAVANNFAKIRTRVSLFSVSHVKPCVLACTFLVLLAKYQGRGVWLACFYF